MLPDRPDRFGITRALINELDELIAAGRTDDAILRVREATTLELKDARGLVDALEHGKPMPEALRYCPPPPQPPPDLELLASEARPYLGRGKKLRAIQLIATVPSPASRPQSDR